MGLDMTYGLSFDTEIEAENFYNILCSSFTNNEDFYINNTSVSIYYRLNWGGVRRERNIFMSNFIVKYGKPVSSLDPDLSYILVENGTFILDKDAITPDKINNIYNLSEIDDLFDKNFTFPVNPVDLLSLGKWNGSNGENYNIVKESTINIYDGAVDYDDEGEEILLDGFGELISSYKKEKFNNDLSNNLSFIKDAVDRPLVNSIPVDYINTKSREILFVLKHFMYNPSRLHVYMG